MKLETKLLDLFECNLEKEINIEITDSYIYFYIDNNENKEPDAVIEMVNGKILFQGWEEEKDSPYCEIDLTNKKQII